MGRFSFLTSFTVQILFDFYKDSSERSMTDLAMHEKFPSGKSCSKFGKVNLISLKNNLNSAEATFEEIIGAVEDISFDANIKSLVENALVFFDKKMINRGALSNSVKVLLLKFWANMLDREKSDKKLESSLFKVEVCLFYCLK